MHTAVVEELRVVAEVAPEDRVEVALRPRVQLLKLADALELGDELLEERQGPRLLLRGEHLRRDTVRLLERHDDRRALLGLRLLRALRLGADRLVLAVELEERPGAALAAV